MTRKLFIIGFALSSLLATAQSETEQQQVSTPTRSRTTAEAPQEEKQYPATIEGQFDELVDKAGNWEKFKLVKKESIYTFKRTLLDSLNGQKTLLREKLDTISAQSSRIKELNRNIQSLQNELDKEKNRNDSIDFLGLTIEKGVYSIIVWGIIVVLTILLVVFISRYTSSNIITRGALKDLENLQNEYEEYRTKAIEREQKVRRQLQDEINKHRS
ncbi:hypothetical protein [uncultured Capnocytophaga sp.]|uniref:hypothetical protein n=1 Tax=uncultured Capnocytophaga sp. TaxID=159273 RepID=UPI00261FBE95|nr:hypothetical protein [uncultured Capnocytophaga sp.]